MTMNLRDSAPGSDFCIRQPISLAAGIILLLLSNSSRADLLPVPNASFESPPAPAVAPYASPEVDSWQKSSQPAWYDPSQNSNTPWEYLIGEFFNVPFPGQFIENCDGNQAAFVFAVPGAGLFQDYNTVYGTNSAPDHAFNAKYLVGASYDLTLAVLGGGGGMQPGATIQFSLYYRDESSNKVVVASTTVTNTTSIFPTNTHFVDFKVRVPAVKQSDPWAGLNIGIEIMSTAGFELAGGYWDIDNVRLNETLGPVLRLGSPKMAGGQIVFSVLSEPGVQFEVQASTGFSAASTNWIPLGTFTNLTGVTVFTDSVTNFTQRYYRTRQL